MSVDPSLIAEVKQAHLDVYGVEPVGIIASPGRVNLIGEHTDYNEGFVLPLAIDRHTVLGLTPRTDRIVRLWSRSFADGIDDVVEFDIDAIGDGGSNGGRAPGDYARGVAHVLARYGEELGVHGATLHGCDMSVVSNLPIGASLSSSASFELAVMMAFVSSTPGARFLPLVAARLGQLVENRWIGLQSGIMDQMVCASAKEGFALLVDCRDLATGNVVIPAGVSVVVLDTGKRRELAGSEYNVRRAQCVQAARAFGVNALRDATVAMLAEHKETLADVVYRRARHVIGENARTTAAAAALKNGDLAKVGELMRASHASLRDDYEVSVRELDLMADVANAHPFVIGARMTGGGFGGCAVALVDSSRPGQLEAFCRDVEAGYRAQSECEPAVYACVASEGTHVVGAA